MKRAILIVLDSVGIGTCPDSKLYGDEGSNTLMNIKKAYPQMELKNLNKLGLSQIDGDNLFKKVTPVASYGRIQEASRGKDTTTGHWEIAGLNLDEPFPTYPDGFPKEITELFEKEIGRKTIGNYPASGTEIINDLGDEHIRTGYPIIYTSADSVFQIACHEDIIPLETLYKYCEIARKILVGKHSVGRVIARPFIGEKGNFTRTKNRKDFSLLPPEKTLLDYIKEAKMEVCAVGKIEDIFAFRGITKSNHTTNNEDGIKATIHYMQEDFNGLIFTNLVDFDTLYGHRNDVLGYKNALEYFDNKLPEITDNLKDDDILFITADHGCDPTTASTDHSREYVPLFVYGKKVKSTNLHTLNTFSCIGKTILDYLGIENELKGTSFLKLLQ